MAGPTATNPALWLKADAGVYNDAGSTPATDGQAVQQWNDQSGNGRHHSQATSGDRPVYETGLFQGGLPGVRFTSAGTQYMDGSLGGGLGQPNTVYMVMRMAVVAGGNKTLYSSQGGGENALIARTDWLQYAGTDRTGGKVGGTVSLMESLFSGASSFTAQNGVSIIAANSGTQSLDSSRIGAPPGAPPGGSFFDGHICEYLVYNADLGPAERAEVRAYLKARWFGEFPATGYVLATFQNAAPAPCLEMLSSGDGITWDRQFCGYPPDAGFVRDPGIIRVATDLFWLAHTNTADPSGSSNTFSVATSADGVFYTHVANVDCTAVTGITRAWAPEWFEDPSASQGYRVFFAAEVSGAFQFYEVHPTNAGFTAWSTPAAVTGTSLPSNMIDAFPVKIGSMYYLWYKNETTKYIEVLSSSSLASGYTVLRTGDWMGVGDQVEGPSLLRVGSTWRLYLDRYGAGTGLAYTEQAAGAGDWAGTNANAWSALTSISVGGEVFSHGTVTYFAPPATAGPLPLVGGGVVNCGLINRGLVY